MKLNVGCGRNILEGWVNVDKKPLPGVDIVHDVQLLPLQLPDNFVEEFLLSHFIEHVWDPLELMQELHRVAKPGAHMTVRTPYGSSDDAWEDPTHVRPYFVNSFGYFSQPYYWRADYGYRGDWRVKKVTLFIREGAPIAETPAAWGNIINLYRNVVQEMVAELEAVKPIREPKKELQEPVNVVIAPCNAQMDKVN